MPTRKLPNPIYIILALFFLTSPASAHSPLDGVDPLRLIAGTGVELHQPGLPDAPVIRVYWFWSPLSSCAREAEPFMAEVTRRLPDVEVYIVHSNVDESAQTARELLSTTDFPLPVYRDEGASLAAALGARFTPDVFIYSAEGLIYQGRSFADGRSRRNFVEETIREYRNSGTVQTPRRRSVGCTISRPFVRR